MVQFENVYLKTLRGTRVEILFMRRLFGVSRSVLAR